MKTCSCTTILHVSGCLIICGMIAFVAFKAWKRDFARLRRERKWRSQKEPVENDDKTCETVSFIM